MILVDAPGFRPTALDAPMPINPTPIAAPSAARPTCRLPVIAVSFLCGRRSVRGLLVLADQEREDGGEQHEHHRLYESNEQFHEVERNRQQPSEPRDHG